MYIFASPIKTLGKLLESQLFRPTQPDNLGRISNNVLLARLFQFKTRTCWQCQKEKVSQAWMSIEHVWQNGPKFLPGSHTNRAKTPHTLTGRNLGGLSQNLATRSTLWKCPSLYCAFVSYCKSPFFKINVERRSLGIYPGVWVRGGGVIAIWAMAK